MTATFLKTRPWTWEVLLSEILITARLVKSWTLVPGEPPAVPCDFGCNFDFSAPSTLRIFSTHASSAAQTPLHAMYSVEEHRIIDESNGELCIAWRQQRSIAKLVDGLRACCLLRRFDVAPQFTSFNEFQCIYLSR